MFEYRRVAPTGDGETAESRPDREGEGKSDPSTRARAQGIQRAGAARRARRGAPSRCYSITVAIFDRTGMFVESNPGV
jgi:hypothetical protein